MSVGAQADVSLDELLEQEEQDGDGVHLACACRAHIMLCGIYMPGVGGVDLVADGELICANCRMVWERGGCPACSCGPNSFCHACIQSSAGR